MMLWVLVFWLQYPENSVEHSVYSTERECRDNQQLWQRRFDIVKSKLVSECRRREL